MSLSTGFRASSVHSLFTHGLANQTEIEPIRIPARLDGDVGLDDNDADLVQDIAAQTLDERERPALAMPGLGEPV